MSMGSRHRMGRWLVRDRRSRAASTRRSSLVTSATYTCRHCGSLFSAPTTGYPYPDDCGAHALDENGRARVFELHIPELRQPCRAILDRPERLFVAWHKDAKGIHELLNSAGVGRYGVPQEDLWEVREYARAILTETAAYYEPVHTRTEDQDGDDH